MAAKQRIILNELEAWRDQGLIDDGLHGRLSALYPAKAWDVGVIVRWTLVTGAILLGTGLIALLAVLVGSLDFFAFILSALALGSFAGSCFLTSPRSRFRLPKTGAALLLLSCLLLGADVVVIARLVAPEGEHWPPLVLVISLAWLAIAYWRRNPAVLVLGLLGLAGWYGAESGYLSGWGAYFLGLNYPWRFALASPLVILAGWLQQRFIPRVDGNFPTVFYVIGLLYANLALWILSIFGNHDEAVFGGLDYHGELLLYSLAWLGVSIGSLLIGARSGRQLFTGFAVACLALNIYTRYFEYFWEDSDKWLFFIILGAITLGAGLVLERWMKRRRRAMADSSGARRDDSNPIA